MFYIDPLSTNFRDEPDFNESDRAREFELLAVRQRAIEEILRGELSPSDLLEILESQEIDPTEYMDAATGAIEFVLNQGIGIEGWDFSTT
jgi:hypothetical protein